MTYVDLTPVVIGAWQWIVDRQAGVIVGAAFALFWATFLIALLSSGGKR